MYNAMVEIARQSRSQSADLPAWRKGSATLVEAVAVRRQSYHLDFTDLDSAADRLNSALEWKGAFVSRLGAARDFYDSLDRLMESLEEGSRGMYSVKKRLFSLICRTRSVLREMTHQSRAPEFDDQALRGILKDYESLRA